MREVSQLILQEMQAGSSYRPAELAPVRLAPSFNGDFFVSNLLRNTNFSTHIGKSYGSPLKGCFCSGTNGDTHGTLIARETVFRPAAGIERKSEISIGGNLKQNLSSFWSDANLKQRGNPLIEIEICRVHQTTGRGGRTVFFFGLDEAVLIEFVEEKGIGQGEASVVVVYHGGVDLNSNKTFNFNDQKPTSAEELAILCACCINEARSSSWAHTRKQK